MEDRISVFTSDDKSLKLLGELLGNDTGRKIIRCLIERQMYTSELATKLGIPISLVIHHLKKLEELNLVDVEEKRITRKTKNHKFFRMTGKFFVLPNDSKDDINETGMLGRIFKEKVRYTLTGAAASSAFILVTVQGGYQKAFTGEPPAIPFESAFVPFLIVIAGLAVEGILRHKKRRGVN